jgi:integrase
MASRQMRHGRTLEPFEGVAEPRHVFLNAEQQTRLINVCQGAFKNLVIAGLLTGHRYGELVQLRVRDFDRDSRTLSIPVNKTKRRVAYFSADDKGTPGKDYEFFLSLATGRHPDDLLLPKDDGSMWGDSHQVRSMKDARERAKLPDATVVYSLRHTYLSEAVAAGVNLLALAKNCGTSVRMLETNYAKFLPQDRSRLLGGHQSKIEVPLSNVVSI